MTIWLFITVVFSFRSQKWLNVREYLDFKTIDVKKAKFDFQQNKADAKYQLFPFRKVFDRCHAFKNSVNQN